MKKIALFALTIFCCAIAATAQSHDEAKMQKDLEITRNILTTLMKTDAGVVMPDHAIDAEYIEDYGVVYYLESNAFAFNVKRDKTSQYMIGEDVEQEVIHKLKHIEEVEQRAKLLEKQASELEQQAVEMERGDKLQEEQIGQIKRQAREIEKQARQFELDKRKGSDAPVVVTSDQLNNEKMEEVALTFLTGYGHLIGQLSAEERITIRKVHSGSLYVFRSLHDHKQPLPSGSQYSVTAQKKDLDAFRSGNISLDALRKKIITEGGEHAQLPTDIIIFADIFKKYYSPDLTETFFVGKTPRCEMLAGFGVVVHSKMFSSYIHGDVYSMPSVGLQKVNASERQDAIEDLYPKFEQDIVEFMLDYGRTIRSVQPSERIMLKLEMTKCESCNIPKSIELLASAELLRDYDQQKINRKKALQSIEIRRQY